MGSHKLIAGATAWCNFDKNETNLLKNIQEIIIKKFAKQNDSKAVQEINEIFDEAEVKELVQKKLKPEIGKMRPVLIIHSDEIKGFVIVLPLTSVKPTTRREKKNMVFLPKDKKPKILGKEDSWIICNMPYYASFKRFRSNQVSDLIDKEIYKSVIRKYKSIIKDEII